MIHSRVEGPHAQSFRPRKFLEYNRTLRRPDSATEPDHAEKKQPTENTEVLASIEIEFFQTDIIQKDKQNTQTLSRVPKRNTRLVRGPKSSQELYQKIVGPSPPEGLAGGVAKITTEISEGVALAITNRPSANGEKKRWKSVDAKRRGEPTPYRRKWFANEEGDLELQSKAIAAVIGKDGQITIGERPLIEHKVENIFHIRYTEWLTRKMGADPNLSNKLAVLNETRSFRVDRIRRWNKKKTADALRGLPAELENLWGDEKLSLIDRERLIRALLEECADTDGGKIAQRKIRQFMNSKGISLSSKIGP